MDLSDRVSEDLIKIFHNAKGSIFNDVLKWNQALENTNQNVFQGNENSDSCTTVYKAKNNRDEENPSIFGDQPVSEYAQQPFPSKKNNLHEDNDKSSEAELEKKLPDEERLILEGLRRDEDIEQHRSKYEGFNGKQR